MIRRLQQPVHPYVCLFKTLRYCVKTAKHIVELLRAQSVWFFLKLNAVTKFDGIARKIWTFSDFPTTFDSPCSKNGRQVLLRLSVVEVLLMAIYGQCWMPNLHVLVVDVRCSFYAHPMFNRDGSWRRWLTMNQWHTVAICSICRLFYLRKMTSVLSFCSLA